MLDHASFASFGLGTARTITAGDPRAPRDLGLLPLGRIDARRGRSTLVLPPESWTVVSATASA